MRFIPLLLTVTLLSACATTAPAPSGVSGPLRLCGGTHISNAPDQDANGVIDGYLPIRSIRGNDLLVAPVRACLSSAYGQRSGGAGSVHKGIDLFTATPRPVSAAGSGTVDFVGKQSGYGKIIIIRHRNGVTTRYAHLSSFASALRKGQKVQQGDIIGQTGKTGNATAVHLHYEILIGAEQIDPLAF